MQATLMQGKPLAERIRAQVAEDVRELGPVALTTVQVGDDEASRIYLRRKHEAARDAGIISTDHQLRADAAEDELLDLLGELNADEALDGILVQLPLPSPLDEARVIRAIDPVKDVDGFHPVNAGHLYLGRPTLVPATPLGIVELLDEYGVELAGARAVVIGRSDIVGKPVAHLLLQRNATVTVCHSRTTDLAQHTRAADVLVVAAGRPGVLTAEMVQPGAAIVDVGINRTQGGIVGDVDATVADVAGRLTPVPGGVGPMTIAMLLRNTVKAARYRRGELAFPQVGSYGSAAST